MSPETIQYEITDGGMSITVSQYGIQFSIGGNSKMVLSRDLHRFHSVLEGMIRFHHDLLHEAPHLGGLNTKSTGDTCDPDPPSQVMGRPIRY